MKTSHGQCQIVLELLYSEDCPISYDAPSVMML